jgi:hypothetical protein
LGETVSLLVTWNDRDPSTVLRRMTDALSAQARALGAA